MGATPEHFIAVARQALTDALTAVHAMTPESECVIEATTLSSVEELVRQLRQVTSLSQGVTSDTSTKTYSVLKPSPQLPKDAQPEEKTPSIWSGFYNKTLRERMDVLSLMYPSAVPRRSSDTGDLQGSPQRAPRKSSLGQVPSLSLNADEIGHLPSRTANLMIENCIGVLGIPLGLGLNFIIDGTPYSVPMAVEEPSVVAAASSAAKLVASHGGFRTATSGNVMTSQIQLVDIKDIPAAMQAIHDHRKSLIEYANTHLCGNMARRGGGVVHIYPRLVQDPSTLDSTDGWYAAAADELRITASGSTPFIVVHIDVDVCEAMGANIVNTIAEGLSSQVAALTNSRAGLRILTNLCTARRARASFSIPVASMGWKGTEGSVVAQRILEANDFAIRDPYRAVTNNKGILNGIDAAAVATGQDWRAIEASAHCFASRTGRYTSLSQYRIEDGFLHGYLELPLSVGSKGGALQTHPGYASTHAILGRPTAQQLSGILVSVGLAQNFAAIRALAITGINQGHMALHARNIAVAAGAPNELVTELCVTVAYMLARGSINVETAKAYLKAHAVYHDIIQSDAPQLEKKRQPSMLYVEINVPGLAKPVSVNLAFLSVRGDIPQTIVVSKLKTSSSQPTSMHAQLLGDKGYVQLERMFMFLATMRVVVGSDKERTNLELQNKLLLLSILINLVMYQLMKKDKKSCQAFANQLVVHGMDVKTATGSEHWTEAFFATQDDPVLSTGLPLLLALWQVFHYHIEQEVANPILQQALVAEQAALVDSIANWQSPQRSNDAAASFVEYMEKHAKRWQATMFLLVDCLALDNQSLTPARLDFVKQAGRYIEWQGTVAHDLARFERAYVDPEERNVCVWFKSHVYRDCTMDEASVAFTKLSKDNAAAQWSSLEHLNKTHEEKVVHLAALESVVKTIVLHYGDDASKSRKLSF